MRSFVLLANTRVNPPLDTLTSLLGNALVNAHLNYLGVILVNTPFYVIASRLANTLGDMWIPE